MDEYRCEDCDERAYQDAGKRSVERELSARWTDRMRR